MLIKKFILVLLLTSTIICVSSNPSDAFSLYRRQVNVIYNNNGTTSDIVLSWTFQTGDRLFKTWDGKNWNEISLGSPVNGDTVTVTGATGVPYYANIYFELREQGFVDRYVDNVSYNTNNPKFTTIPVYPPLKNAHSDLSANTEYCAGCHVTHAAEGPYLMKAPNRTALCFTCHGGAGTGSRYNVEKGTVLLNNGTFAKALGGAFSGGSEPWGYKTTTSTHVYNYSEQTYAPGWDIPEDIFTDVDCSACHTTHASRSSYRMLRGGSFTNIYAWVYNPAGLGETPWYEYVNDLDCNACHGQFKGFSGSGSTRSFSEYPVFGVSHDVYRHNAQNADITTYGGGLTTTLPIQTSADGSQKKMMCLTCHYPHGTVATGNELSSFDKNVNSVYDDYTTALKRMDNYGVCEDCHKK